MISKNFLHPSANLLLDQMVFLTVCTARLAAAGVGVIRTVFIPKSTEVDAQDILPVRLKLCGLLLYAIPIGR